jgi:hypothetical protein
MQLLVYTKSFTPSDSYISRCKKISKRTLSGTWKDTLEIVLSPVAVSRLQSVFVDYLLSHPELMDDTKKLKIAVIEQDVPCGTMAFDDFNELKYHLQNLSNDTVGFPNIEVDIYSSKEFLKSALHKTAIFKEIFNLEDFDLSNHDYNVVFDISILS